MFEQKFNDDKSEEEQFDEKIVLDKSAFKALASDTRIAILKELDKRRKTLTELSETLNLAVATVKEHVDQLSKSKLVVVRDEGRKWKYCELTEKGKAVLYPERRKIWVMLASVVFMVFLSFYMTYHDIGYVSSQGLLSSDSIEPSSARILISPEVEGQDLDRSDEHDAEMDAFVMTAELDDDEYNESYGDDLVVEAFGEGPEIFESYTVHTDGVPYLRYLAYALTSVSAISLIIFATFFSKNKKI